MKTETPNAQRPTSNVQSSEVVSPSTIDHQPSTFWWAWRALDLIIGGIFVYAGVIKALDPITFATDIHNYKILPWTIGVRLAFYLPWLEILCGLALITRRFYAGGLSILTALVSVFIIASIVAKARGIDITCGCFGHVSQNWSFTLHLTLISILFAGLLALWFAQRKKFSRS